MAANKDELDDFYDVLKSGITVKSFLEKHAEIFGFVHARGLTNDYRLGKGRMKKLRDEIAPVARFVRAHTKPEDRIRFALDSTHPDCTLCHQDGRRREVEVTVAQAQERFRLMTELNEKGTARGFLGITDDSARQDFEDRMGCERKAYSSEEVLRCIQSSVELCAQNKLRYGGDTLLIEAPLETLPVDRWSQLPERFADNEQLKALSFSEVYVTGSSGDGSGWAKDICLKIK